MWLEEGESKEGANASLETEREKRRLLLGERSG